MLNNQAPKEKIKALTEAQRNVFDLLCIESGQIFEQEILDFLEQEELVYKSKQNSGFCTTFNYFVPWSVHIAWCDLCDEELTN